MNYEVYDMGSYKLHCIRSLQFKKTNVLINLKSRAKKSEITYRTLLTRVLMESSKKYKTSREMVIETENLYNLYLKSTSYLSGNYNIISFDATFLNNEYTDDDLFSNAIDFIIEILTNPNVENDEFANEPFTLAKNLLKEELDTFKDDPNQYSYFRLFEEIDKKSVSAYPPLGTIKELEKITPKKLYQYYKKFIKEDQIDIFVISPLDKETVKKIFLNKISFEKRYSNKESHYISYKDYRKRVKIVREKENYEQSKLLIGCKFDDLTPFEIKYVSLVYSYILGGGPSSKLFQTVREKNSLCYSISSSFKQLNKYLIISSGINPDSFNKCYRLIKKELKNMSNGNFEKEKIEEAKVTYISSMKEIKDSPRAILSTYVSHEYMDMDFLDEREEKIKEVTYNDVVNFAKKLHIDTVYILEGDAQNE